MPVGACREPACADATALVRMGRRRVPGCEPARRILVRSRIAAHGGAEAIVHPYYELPGNP
jgi:hypothetical protein